MIGRGPRPWHIVWLAVISFCLFNQLLTLFQADRALNATSYLDDQFLVKTKDATSSEEKQQAKELFDKRNFAPISHPDGTREILHVFQYGVAPPLTTNILCVSLFLHVRTRHPELLKNVICNNAEQRMQSDKRGLTYFLERNDIPQAVKSRVDESKLPSFNNSTVVFTSAPNESAAAQKRAQLQAKGYTVGIVQDLQTLEETSIRDMVGQYGSFFQLAPDQISIMIHYFELWDQLRECCGMRMNKHWRNELVPDAEKWKDMISHKYCGSIDINEVESKLMNTDLYKVLGKSKHMDRIRRPTAADGNLDGSYCSRYNNAVRKHGITMNKNIFGQNNWFLEVPNHLLEEMGDPFKDIEHDIPKVEQQQTETSLIKANASRKSKSQFSPWVQEYIAFHQSSIVDGKLKDGVRYIVYECKDGSVRCGGAGDRLVGMIKMFYLAMSTRRVLVIDATFPVPLTKVLNPAHIAWNVSFPATDLYLPDMVYNESFGLREETLGYRIRQTNAYPRKKALNEIWGSDLMNEHFRKNKWSDLAITFTLASAAREAFMAMFHFDSAVLKRAEEFKASANITGPYAGLHMRKGDSNMGVSGQTKNELQGLKSRKTDNNVTLNCYHNVKHSHPHTFEIAYLASDDVPTKTEMSKLDPSIHFAQNMKPFHVDLLARDGENKKIDALDPVVLSGTIDAWAEMLVLSQSTCLILSQSMFSFGSLYMRHPEKGCVVRLNDCLSPHHREGRFAYYGEQIYQRGWVIIANATSSPAVTPN